LQVSKVKILQILLLKIIIVPLFLLLISLISKKFGAFYGGIVSGLPAVAGPIIYVLGLEHDNNFAAATCYSALYGLSGFMAFGVAYSWAARKFNWIISLFFALCSWAIMVAIMMNAPHNLGFAIMVAIISLAFAKFALPPKKGGALPAPLNLYIRLISGALLTLLVSKIATHTTGIIAGFAAVFPIFGIILMSETHRNDGAQECANLFHGWIIGLISFLVFFAVLPLLLAKIQLGLSFILATIICLIAQSIIMIINHKRAS